MSRRARLPLSDADLANTRFAFSALWETVASYWALKDPSRHALHLPWIREVEGEVAQLDLRLLDVLLQPRHYADFLTPAPTTPLPDVDSELAALAATPAEVVREQVRGSYPDLPERDLAPFLDDPEATLAELVASLRSYWERCLAHHWPRMRALLEADVAHRARTLALRGPEALFAELNPKLRFQDGALEFLGQGSCPLDGLEPAGRGLLLIPSIFTKSFTVTFTAEWREILQYRARGVYALWHPELPPGDAALAHLLGDPRSRLLRQLATPAGPSELAGRFGVTPSAVSQHLAWLRRAGLVTAQRRGKRVRYELSDTGAALLSAYGELPEPDALALSA